MNNDLISRAAILKELRNWGRFMAAIECACERIEEFPAVDAETVVRCKECKYFDRKTRVGGFCICGEVVGSYPKMRVNEDFCSYGAKMDGGAADEQ